MDIVKSYVNRENKAVIKCPECGSRKTVPVGKFKGAKHVLSVKCGCQHLFEVQLDFRGKYRKDADLDAFYASKDTNLDGFYVKVGTNDNNPLVEQKTGSISVNCKIRNISLSGILLTPLGHHNLKVDDRLRVRFFLDDQKQSLIDKKLVVRRVHGKDVGCEFLDADMYDKTLGFYLLP